MECTIVNARIFTGCHWIEKGHIQIRKGLIHSLGPGFPGALSGTPIDVKGATVAPGIVDCHTHLLEFAAMGVEHARGSAQIHAGHANLLKAAQAGVTALGEHFLGHPVLAQPLDKYLDVASQACLDVRLCTGWCVVGTEPLTVLAAASPGQTLLPENLDQGLSVWLAENNQFPGESIFVTATVANLPPQAVPRGGEVFWDEKQIKEAADIFHRFGQRLGAHVEGDAATRAFIRAGGDVVHHGHGISDATVRMLAAEKTDWVITPHGGTASLPTAPDQIALALELGLQPALASDSYLPVHPGARWLTEGLPPGEIGPREFMVIIHNLAARMQQLGVGKEEIIRMLTLYPAKILGLEDKLGTLEPGKQADLIVAPGLWGVEVANWRDISLVIKKGETIVAK